MSTLAAIPQKSLGLLPVIPSEARNLFAGLRFLAAKNAARNDKSEFCAIAFSD